jgi:hypothetical protein
MDNYKEILTELNDIIVKISDFEKELMANKERIEFSIIKTKEYIDNQILQFKENKESFQTSIQLIEAKYENVINDIHNQIEIDFQGIINDKLDRMKSVLYPLETELKQSNVESQKLQELLDRKLKSETENAHQEFKELGTELIKKIGVDLDKKLSVIDNFSKVDSYFNKVFKILSDIRQSQDTQLMNLKNMQISINDNNNLIDKRIDEIIDNQDKILKTFKIKK